MLKLKLQYPLQYSGLENSMESMGSQRVGHDWAAFTFFSSVLGQWEPFLMSKTFMYPLIIKFVILAIYCEFKCLGGYGCKMMKPGLLSSRQGKRWMCVFGRLIRLSLENGSTFCLFPQPSHALFKMLSDELGRINLKVFFTGTLQWSYGCVFFLWFSFQIESWFFELVTLALQIWYICQQKECILFG